MRHKQMRSGEQPFSCDMCNKVFNEKCTLMTRK
jgi:transposase-like protein